MRRPLLASLLLLPLVAACTPRRSGPEARPDAAASALDVGNGGDVVDAGSADAADAADADATAPDAVLPFSTPLRDMESWKDPRAAVALATRCDWTPWQDDDRLQEDMWFSCESHVEEQACAFDPCWDARQACRPGCARRCVSCDARCVSTCGTCEAACKDDACRVACGKRTARCRDSCSTQRDRCFTAECAAGYEACNVSFQEMWTEHHCGEACSQPKYLACTRECSDDECAGKCAARYAPGCSGEAAFKCTSDDADRSMHAAGARLARDAGGSTGDGR